MYSKKSFKVNIPYKIIYFFLISIIGTVYSQADSVLSYMPLQIGNQWQYKVHYVVTGPSNIDTTYYSFSLVERDTIMPNGYQYQVIKNSNLYQEYNYIHIDSVTACVYEYSHDSSRGFKTDSLKCVEGDWFGAGSYCMFIDTSRVLNYRTWIMSIDRSQPDITVAHTLAMDIGMSYHTKAESEGTWWETTTRTAVYANINGNEYGELVSVKNNRKSNLFDFNLDQNYPNPFNPSTKIKYQISELSFVTLKVFDVLGNETITLVNEEKTAGNYEVEFNGTELTSGIYFYRIQAGNYVETMKMVLMK